MKQFINNKFNLLEEDINEIVKRVKILLINSNNEILLGYCHNNYQFPGGHVEENEELIDTVYRELKEETGIELDKNNIEPFACSLGYYKDYPKPGINSKIEIYYYEIRTDVKPNLDNTLYTEHEIDGNFCLRYFSLDKVQEELKANVEFYGDKKGITAEMLELLNYYKY